MPHKTFVILSKIVILNIVFQYKYLNIKKHILGKQTDLKYVFFFWKKKLKFVSNVAKLSHLVLTDLEQV